MSSDYASSIAPLPIAQVQTPSGSVWYIAHARAHQGFVVQRCYRGVQENASHRLGHRFFDALLQPFLNPGAVQAAGLTLAEVQDWMELHPGEIFTHPLYASLCLRWGTNAHGYRVEELAAWVAATEKVVPFTPHTCWYSGITYYQLALPEPISFPLAPDEALLLALLQDQAGLVRHEREEGTEGAWLGWYTTDRAAAEQALAFLDRSLVLAQPSFHYGVWLQLTPHDSGDEQRRPLALYASSSEAQAHFSALRKAAGATAPGGFPRLTHGHVVQWPGQLVQWNPMDTLCVRETFALSALAQEGIGLPGGAEGFPPVRTIAFEGYLAEPELRLC